MGTRPQGSEHTYRHVPLRLDLCGALGRPDPLPASPLIRDIYISFEVQHFLREALGRDLTILFLYLDADGLAALVLRRTQRGS
jgi:hypothetical protein